MCSLRKYLLHCYPSANKVGLFWSVGRDKQRPPTAHKAILSCWGRRLESRKVMTGYDTHTRKATEFPLLIVGHTSATGQRRHRAAGLVGQQPASTQTTHPAPAPSLATEPSLFNSRFPRSCTDMLTRQQQSCFLPYPLRTGTRDCVQEAPRMELWISGDLRR